MTSTKARLPLPLPLTLKFYIVVQSEETARQLERCFESGSGKAFENKRLW